MSETPFFLNSWLKQGAIIGETGQWVEVYWGDLYSYSEPPISGPAIYQNDFFLKEQKPWKVFSQVRKWSWDEWQNYLRAHMIDSDDEQHTWEEPKKEKFRQTFSEIIDAIHGGKILKAVPVVYEKSPKQSFSQLRSLLSSPKNTYVYGFWQNARGFLGFTPELLFKKQKTNHWQLMALAGTCFREDFEKNSHSFLSDTKERKEHQIVVSDIKNKVSSLGEVTSGEIYSLKLDQLVHLCTDLKLTSDTPLSFQKLVSCLHPTSALGVFPPDKINLLQSWRDTWSLVGAPFGVSWDAENYLCLVAIRHIQWDESQLYIGAGCGLVEESQLEQEWRELFLKRESIKSMLSL